MNDFRHFSTERLSLRAVRARDAYHIFWLNSDPRVWVHRPAGVHTSREQTEAQVTGYIEAWDRDGLGCWVARTHDGTFVGIGGCSVKDRVGWNVFHRLLPEVQGRGYEAELVRAAITAASVMRPELPIVALIMEQNAASRAAAESAGLTEVWRGADEDSEDAGAVRLVYADRELPADVIEILRAHSRPRPPDPADPQAGGDAGLLPPVPEAPRSQRAWTPPDEPPDGPAVPTQASAPHDRPGQDPLGSPADEPRASRPGADQPEAASLAAPPPPPDQSASDQSAPDQSAPDQSASDQSASDQAASDQAASDQAPPAEPPAEPERTGRRRLRWAWARN
jgi:RimJ/RimL family protein N-acetyltransferase